MVLHQEVTEGGHAQAPLSFLEFQIHLEDVELCRRADGSLWSLGKGSFGTGNHVRHVACLPDLSCAEAQSSSCRCAICAQSC